MTKYINLDEATDLFRGIDATMAGSFVADTLESLPTIDIVHCGECKCCRDELIEEHVPLYIYCEKWNHETDFDGFCKWGERIDNEQI